MTPDMMVQRANTFTQKGSELRDLTSQMDNLNNQLQSEWDGAAADAFNSRWNGDLKKSFNDAADLIDQISSALNSSAQTMQDSDQHVASQLAG
jgi:WXG100 family type VII secretion target